MSYRHVCRPCILRLCRQAGPAVSRQDILSRLTETQKAVQFSSALAYQKRQLSSASEFLSLLRKTLTSSKPPPRGRRVRIRPRAKNGESEVNTAGSPKSIVGHTDEAQNPSQNVGNDTEEITKEASSRAAKQSQDNTDDGHATLKVPVQAHLDEAKNSGRREENESLEDAVDDDSAASQLDAGALQTLTTEGTTLVPLDLGKVNVPGLSFDLSRVLFNPGVYQLQDPRSRVYNFDPYLQKVMAVSEFDFDALNQYVTSSEDDSLRNLAIKQEKRYVGSSSSMTAVLSHFHFLLSSWREINLGSLSKDFRADSTNFTRIHRAPSAIFLRWRDGVYGVDADKEFDSANILMSLGRSMEKLLTLEKHEYERYRKSETSEQQELDSEPEAYHYGEMGKFLLRSQLDAHDPRLPGTGVFDLKTRAVVAVRMSLSQHEKGLGYQIKERQGTWESYEREYYDMIRSAFLKYSLQVRIGRMDGVFVTYHNVERIFGFQYISLPEMDLALHGQTDRSLGDREFGFSVKLMGEIFDRATQQFPEQSIRFHFETRASAAKVREKIHRMYIFAEPMSEEQIQGIQKRNNAEIAAYEERLRNRTETSDSDTQSNDEDVETTKHSLSLAQDNAADVNFLDSLGESMFSPDAVASKSSTTDGVSRTANGDSVNEETPATPRHPLIGFELVIRNMIQGHSVVRPEKITASDRWTVDYNLTTMKEDVAHSKYAACKMRRKVATSSDEGQQTVNSFFQNLIKLSEKGAIWRQKQDELDATRDPVVLYQSNNDGKRAAEAGE